MRNICSRRVGIDGIDDSHGEPDGLSRPIHIVTSAPVLRKHVHQHEPPTPFGVKDLAFHDGSSSPAVPHPDFETTHSDAHLDIKEAAGRTRLNSALDCVGGQLRCQEYGDIRVLTKAPRVKRVRHKRSHNAHRGRRSCHRELCEPVTQRSKGILPCFFLSGNLISHAHDNCVQSVLQHVNSLIPKHFAPTQVGEIEKNDLARTGDAHGGNHVVKFGARSGVVVSEYPLQGEAAAVAIVLEDAFRLGKIRIRSRHIST